MRKPKFDRVKEKAIIHMLDSAAKKYGLADARHAANKWCGAQRVKARLAKQQRELKKQLAEVNKKLA